jgi:protein-disulfide isomerase
LRTPLDIHQGLLQVPITETDHVLGTPGAPVAVVEYGDYQCPYCAAAHPVVAELLQMRAPVIEFAFRHFPLTNVHEHAEYAAEAAEAAGAQGNYWGMHDWLFDHQKQLQPKFVTAAAEEMGLDPALFTQALAGRQFHSKVQHDFMTGLRSGVNGTPTFFINGVRHDGAASLDELVAAVDRERASAA